MTGVINVVVVTVLVHTRTMTNSKITPMIQFDAQTIILAVIGMVGLFSTATVVAYAFKRNRTGNSRFQWLQPLHLTTHRPFLRYPMFSKLTSLLAGSLWNSGVAEISTRLDLCSPIRESSSIISVSDYLKCDTTAPFWGLFSHCSINLSYDYCYCH